MPNMYILNGLLKSANDTEAAGMSDSTGFFLGTGSTGFFLGTGSTGFFPGTGSTGVSPTISPASSTMTQEELKIQADAMAAELFLAQLSQKERTAMLSDERIGPGLQLAINNMSQALQKNNLQMNAPEVTQIIAQVASADGTNVQYCMLQSLSRQAKTQFRGETSYGNDPNATYNPISWITASPVGKMLYDKLKENAEWKKTRDPIVNAWVDGEKKTVQGMRQALQTPIMRQLTERVANGSVKAPTAINGIGDVVSMLGVPKTSNNATPYVNPYANTAGYQYDPNNISNSGFISGGLGGALALAPFALMSKNPLLLLALGGALGGGYQYGRHAGWWNGYEPVNNLMDAGGKWIGNKFENINDKPWITRNKEDSLADTTYGLDSERQQAIEKAKQQNIEPATTTSTSVPSTGAPSTGAPSTGAPSGSNNASYKPVTNQFGIHTPERSIARAKVPTPKVKAPQLTTTPALTNEVYV